jgi:hypothetical protein
MQTVTTDGPKDYALMCKGLPASAHPYVAKMLREKMRYVRSLVAIESPANVAQIDDSFLNGFDAIPLYEITPNDIPITVRTADGPAYLSMYVMAHESPVISKAWSRTVARLAQYNPIMELINYQRNPEQYQASTEPVPSTFAVQNPIDIQKVNIHLLCTRGYEYTKNAINEEFGYVTQTTVSKRVYDMLNMYYSYKHITGHAKVDVPAELPKELNHWYELMTPHEFAIISCIFGYPTYKKDSPSWGGIASKFLREYMWEYYKSMGLLILEMLPILDELELPLRDLLRAIFAKIFFHRKIAAFRAFSISELWGQAST